MEKVNIPTVSWQDIPSAECDEASLFDMCSWAENN